tara:strand:- start:183 stop:1160 length:978 start_codon:yes stop_codon:yes gene_type:complete
MNTVGLIVNPKAGKDIRRIVSFGRFTTDEEKLNIVVRILTGLTNAGVDKVLAMPDTIGLIKAAINKANNTIPVEILDIPAFGDEQDTVLATKVMVELGVSCIVSLGGDGTNRSIAEHSSKVPMVPISTGTNNVFPILIEGTTAGLAAGLIATNAVDIKTATKQKPLIEIDIDGKVVGVALVDVAISKQAYIGARAVWDPESIDEIFVSGFYPSSIGLASIASRIPIKSKAGIYVKLGKGKHLVSAPITPGVISKVNVTTWAEMEFNDKLNVNLKPSSIAVDGERTWVLTKNQIAGITLKKYGPVVVSISKTLEQAALSEKFITKE